MKTRLWLSCDLGVPGDYEALYAWLDAHQASECGDGLAFLEFEHAGELLAELHASLTRAVQVTPRTRVYVIWQDAPSHTLRGKFLMGGRRAAPWSGYAPHAGAAEDIA